MSNDTWQSTLYGLPYPIYFYYLDANLIKEDNSLSVPLGNCPGLLSVQFVPYLVHKDFNISAKKYDTERFGKVSELRPSVSADINVFRINSIEENSRVKELKEVNTYPKIDKKIGGTRYWKNESRLFNFPYSFAILTDGISPPLQIKYHLSPKPKMKIKVRNTLSDRCSYGLFIQGYKGDSAGQTEAMVSGDIHELPCSSSAYNQWYASSKNSTAQNIQNTINQSFLSSSQSAQMASLSNSQSYTNQNFSQLSSGLSGIGSLLSGNLGGAIGGGMGMMGASIKGNQERQMNNLNAQFAGQQASLDKKSAILGAMAQVKDLSNTPNTMVSMGSDFIYGYNKQGSALKLFRYSITTEYATKLADYFALYGYKQNRLMNIENIKRSRYYYNYIKTIGCNISVNTTMAKDDLEVMKNIFDKGVTIWHIDRKDVEVNNFEMDNFEVEY